MTAKRASAALLTLLLILLTAAVPLSAGAVEVPEGYTGPLDSYTGLPAGWGYDMEEVVEAMDDKRVQITSTMYFDLLEKVFVFPISKSLEVYSSVADGMIVTQPVTLILPDGLSAVLYKDGRAVEVEENTVSAPGNYVLSVTQAGGGISQPLQFAIVAPVTGKVSSYTMPAGFELKRLTCNGDERFVEDSTAGLVEEGQYLVSYMCSKTQEIYELSVTIDHTPPVLQLEGVENGEAHGPVTITSSETGLTVTLLRDNRHVQFATKLTESGAYVLNVTDQAGNMSTYRFDIMPYLNANSIIFLILLAGGIIALVIYLLRARNNIRVR